MADVPQNLDQERLSAYLDGELSDDQREQVELKLAADPSYRQTLDDLQALHRVWQELPREAAPERLAAAVQRRIASMETDRVATLSTAAKGGREDRGLRRGLGWAIAVIAVGIVVMLFEGDPESVEVAQGVSRGEPDEGFRHTETDDQRSGMSYSDIRPLPDTAPPPKETESREQAEGQSAARPNQLGRLARPSVRADRDADTSSVTIVRSLVNEDRLPQVLGYLRKSDALLLGDVSQDANRPVEENQSFATPAATADRPTSTVTLDVYAQVDDVLRILSPFNLDLQVRSDKRSSAAANQPTTIAADQIQPSAPAAAKRYGQRRQLAEPEEGEEERVSEQDRTTRAIDDQVQLNDQADESEPARPVVLILRIHSHHAKTSDQ